MARETSGRIRPKPSKRGQDDREPTRRETDAAARRAIDTNREALTELAKW